MSEELTKLAEQVAEAELQLEQANESVAVAMKGKDIGAVRKAVNFADSAEKALTKVQKAYDDAKWLLDNGERVAATEALHTYLTDTMPSVPEVMSAFELGVPSFTVAYKDGAITVTVVGAKAPGGSRASGNGSGGGRARKIIFDTHTETETPSREWLETYPHGDEKAVNAAIAARSGKVKSRTGKEYIPNFQADLRRVLAMPEIAGRFELRDKVKVEA